MTSVMVLILVVTCVVLACLLLISGLLGNHCSFPLYIISHDRHAPVVYCMVVPVDAASEYWHHNPAGHTTPFSLNLSNEVGDI